MIKKYDIFISYRREGGYDTAKHLNDLLVRDGYSVSFDIDTLRNGDFDTELLKRIDQCKDFIIILNKSALDRCIDTNVDVKNDWLRNELAYALRLNKNIVPILASDFVFPQNLPKDIEKISVKNGIYYNKQYFDAMYCKLKDFLLSRPIYRIKRCFIIGALVTLAIFLIIFSLFGNNGDSLFKGNNVKKSNVDDSCLFSRQVLINAKLLDSVFIKTDSVISKKIDYDAYMGVDRDENGKIWLGPFYETFHYIDTCINGQHCIRPYGNYVGDYYLHDSIVIQDFGFLILGEREYTNSHYPILDVSIVNNSPQTILIDELLIEVEDSHVDPRPFIIMSESGGHLFIEDAGWKSWNKATLRFSLLPEGQKFNGNYNFQIPLSSNDTIFDGISMYDYFARSGIDFNKLSTSSLVSFSKKGEIPYWNGSSIKNSPALDSLIRLLSPVKLEQESVMDWENEKGIKTKEIFYKDPYLRMYGELTFDNGSSLKVGGTIRFMTSEGWGAHGLDCSRVFDVKLKETGTNYTIKYPVSHYLKAGDVDRIAIQMNADKTSYHTFRVRLHNVNQIDIQTEPINILIFKYN